MPLSSLKLLYQTVTNSRPPAFALSTRLENIRWTKNDLNDPYPKYLQDLFLQRVRLSNTPGREQNILLTARLFLDEVRERSPRIQKSQGLVVCWLRGLEKLKKRERPLLSSGEEDNEGVSLKQKVYRSKNGLIKARRQR